MAGKIAGITIELNADASGLQSALKGISKTLKTTQNNLKDINKLLKFNPGNVELLTQKQKNLKNAIDATKKKLEALKEEQKNVEKGSEQWDKLQREIIETENNLSQLQSEYRSFGSVAKQVVQAAGQKMQDFGGKIEDVGRKFAPVSKAAAGLLTSMGALGYKAVTAADDLNTLAKQTGLTTEEIQKMQYAADLIDVSFDDIAGALKKMKPKMTDSNKTFKQLGVSVKDADGNLRSATDVFYDSIVALSKIENETLRDQIAMELFGKSADSLAGIIDDGGAALKAYSDEAEELGMIMDQETLDSLNAVNDAIDQMKARLRGSALKLGAKIAEMAAPLVEKVAAAIEKVVAWLDKLTPEQLKLIATIAGVLAVVSPLLIIVGKIVTGIGFLITAIGALLSPIGLVVVAITALIAAGVALYKNWDKVKAVGRELVKSTVAGWQQLKKDVVNAANNIKTSVVSAWNNLKTRVITIVTNIKTSAVNTWNTLKSSVVNTVNNLVNGAISSFNNLKSNVYSTFENVRSTIQSKIESARQTVQNVFDSIKKVFDTVLQIHLKVPHITVDGGEAPWGIGGKGRKPTFNVDWYKKAYDNPMLFTSPTVLATPGGLKGFGDGHGAEIVMGLNKLRELVGTSGGVVINVYPQQGMDVNQLADAIQNRFIALQKQRSLAYA